MDEAKERSRGGLSFVNLKCLTDCITFLVASWKKEEKPVLKLELGYDKFVFISIPWMIVRTKHHDTLQSRALVLGGAQFGRADTCGRSDVNTPASRGPDVCQALA